MMDPTEKERPPVTAGGQSPKLTLAKGISPASLRQVAMAILGADPELAGLATPEQLAALLPETLGALKVVLRSRIKCPTPAPMVVFPDGREEALDS